MHNNYYFLRQLSRQLERQLAGWELVSCFSQQKDELILGFIDPGNSEEAFYIRAYLDSRFCCLHFPQDFKRAKKNNVDLFRSLTGRKVRSVHQFSNERSFAIIFGEAETSFQLLFKMHGNRANLLLFREHQLEELFRSSLKKDESLQLHTLDRNIQVTFEHFCRQADRLQALYPTFGPLVKDYLYSKGYEAMPVEQQWQLLQEILSQLENPGQYFIISWQQNLHLSLLPFGDVVATHTDPLAAINDFFLRYMKEYYLSEEKQQILKQLQKRKTQSEGYIQKSERKLRELEQGIKPQEIANILMANLHQIPTRATQVELFNFYNNRPVVIKLKEELSPQKNAEVYYRKAKNQQLEIEQLKQNIHQKKQQLQTTVRHIGQLEALQDIKALRQYLKQHQLQEEKQAATQELPFREFNIEGFTVLVGKSAKSNDTLLRQYASKDDLWLHAKDVAGSHVIIRQQAGRKFPKTLIEKAAQLAAYYSKRKTDSLCPVSVTPRKYVRKSKNLAPGQVLVDREETLMVEPQLVTA